MIILSTGSYFIRFLTSPLVEDRNIKRWPLTRFVMASIYAYTEVILPLIFNLPPARRFVRDTVTGSHFNSRPSPDKAYSPVGPEQECDDSVEGQWWGLPSCSTSSRTTITMKP